MGGEDFKFGKMTLGRRRKAGMDEHGQIRDPGFVDPEHADFQLKPGAEKDLAGFRSIRCFHRRPARACAASSPDAAGHAELRMTRKRAIRLKQRRIRSHPFYSIAPVMPSPGDIHRTLSPAVTLRRPPQCPDDPLR